MNGMKNSLTRAYRHPGGRQERNGLIDDTVGHGVSYSTTANKTRIYIHNAQHVDQYGQ